MKNKKLKFDKCYRFSFLTRIGDANWHFLKKNFCDNEKEFKNLSRRSKIIIDKRNNYNSVYVTHKLLIEEFLNNEWVLLEEYYVKNNSKI